MLQKLHVSMFEACQTYSTCAFRKLFFFSLNLSAVPQISCHGCLNLQKTKVPAHKFVFFSPHRKQEAEYNQKLSNVNYTKPFSLPFFD